MKITEIRGVFGPVVTTFDRASGELDLGAFAANVRAHLASGLDGIVVAGSTGEAALLDRGERQALVQAARAAVPAGKMLIVGTGAESTRTAIQQTRDASERGADAALVVAPHYYGSAMTTAALREHYLRVADAAPVPVILYNIPKYMHFSLAAELVAELARHENVVGIKDSSGNRELFASYLPAQSDSFSVLTGSGQLWQHALQSGAHGGILAVALFAAGLTLDIYEAVGRGDTAAATAAQAQLTPIAAKAVGEFGVAGVKAAMDCFGHGLTGGPVRSPLRPLTVEQADTVRELVTGLSAAVPA